MFADFGPDGSSKVYIEFKNLTWEIEVLGYALDMVVLDCKLRITIRSFVDYSYRNCRLEIQDYI